MTETLDKLYLEYAQITKAKTARELMLLSALKPISEAIRISARHLDGATAGDFLHDSWNPDAHIEVTLTIEDIRKVLSEMAYEKD